MATAAGSTIGALRVVIGADTTGFQRGAKEARDGLDGLQKSSKAAIAAVAAIGAAAVAAGVKLFSMARAELDLIDSQSKLSRSMGGTVDGLRSMKIAAENNGIDGLEASLNRLNRRLGAVEMSGGPAAETVKRLGLNVQELSEMDIDERLAHIADAIQASGMSAQEAARHLQQLGFEQREATALFMQGGDAIREAREELDRYGLSVSQIDAARIEDATTAFSRVGRAIDGIKTQLTIALLPAMLIAADMAEAVARGVARIAPYIGPIVDGLMNVAEYAGVAAAGIAALYAPAVLSGIATLTTAIGVGAVGAVRALTAAMLTNPVGAIAAALVAAGYAAYKFRDQISEAIGVDVVDIAKTAANTVINSFIAAYEDIKFVWNNFGDMMGAAVVGGVNVAIRAINRLIDGALSGINSIIAAVNRIPGVNIGKIGDSAKIDLLDNEYAARLVDAVKERNAKIAEIMSTDRFAGTGATPPGTKPPGTPPPPPPPPPGGAADKENDQLLQRLNNLREFLATREELEVQAGIERINLLDESLAAELITEREHGRMLFDVAGNFYDSMSSLRDEEHQKQRDKIKEMHELGIIDDSEYHEQMLELIEEQEQEKTDALVEAFLERKEILDRMRDEGDEDEAWYRDQMELLEEEHQDALTRVAAVGAQARKKIGEDEAKSRQVVMSGMMNNLVQLMNSGNKEMFRVGKVAAVANALLKAKEAIPAAYAAGAKVGGPAVGAAFAATAAAATAAQVAQVRATSFGDTGGAVSSGGGASIPPVSRGSGDTGGSIAPIAPEDEGKHTRVTINLQGEVFNRQQVRDLIEQINEATADGAKLRIA